MSPARARLLAAAAAAIFVLTAAPFFLATTFVGDDHLFLAFSRYVANPLVAFVRDHHGGEFYRPLPMTLWWLLGRLGDGSPVPFAAAGLILHTAAAAQLALLLTTVGEDRRTAWIAALLFFLAPQTLEAAYWYAASTDLLAATATLAALTLLARGHLFGAATFSALAFLSKEAALVLPLLGLVILARRDGGVRRVHLAAIAPLAVLAAVVFAIRWAVLGGWGGAGDIRASLPAKLLQIASGLVHVVTGSTVLPEFLAWSLGILFIAVSAANAGRHLRDGARHEWLPVAFTLAALLPLLAADWIVGARYFYLPSVGLIWFGARWLRDRPPAALVLLVSTVLGLGAAQAILRRHDVATYRARLAAVTDAVSAGVARGHTVFHVTSGIKDLDLALKASPGLRDAESRLLILSDVPASFVVVPPKLEPTARFLLAVPPIPPGGAYRFGDHHIVGLPRRGDDPSLDEVVKRLPDIRFIRLRILPGGRPVAHDGTEQVRRSLE